MAYATGTEVKVAAKKGSAWGSAVECGAGDGLLILPHSLKKTRQPHMDDSLGLAFAEVMDYGGTIVEGELPAYMRYDGLDLLMALCLGATAGAPAQQGGTSAYKQTLSAAPDIDGLFATIALSNGVNIDEYPSVKVAALTLRGQVGQPLELSVGCVSDDRVVDSSINTAATMANVTVAETGNRVLMSQGEFRMNESSGAALGSGDVIRPAAFELSFKRRLKGAYAVGGADRIDEPANNALPEVRLGLAFPRYTDKSAFVDWDSGTAMKLDMTFTGALIESGYSRTLTLRFPNLMYASADLPMQRGALSHPVELVCLGRDTAPEGMPGLTGPLEVELINTMDSDVLA